MDDSLGDQVDVAIIGAGAVGLACAARLARQRRSVVVIERHARPGEETSSRNSGVIHAGLYYAPGSLKALTCVEGRERLYARCLREALPHRKLGKLIVATDEHERTQLETIAGRGRANGAGALRILDARELRVLEPRVHAIAALLSPETGIVDAPSLLASYKREAQQHGAMLCFATSVEAIEPGPRGLTLRARSQSSEVSQIRAEVVVNAAGLAADRIAALAGLDVAGLGYRQHPCKGDYFTLSASYRDAVRHLIYPVPVHAGLGIHLTLDLGGMLRAGPDTEYIDQPRYDIDPHKAQPFADAVRRYFPGVSASDLQPDYAGIRPKLQGPGQAVRDFVIEGASAHGLPGLINLLGIESPGLTASEAIAERVAALLS
jgi:L-2-hydroxyglutarate oxidase LhgO